MSEALLDMARKLQWRGSDPQTSAWVVANAGAGKTHVLTQRVVRLLLDGADPASILCLTFTKAAAAEMASRIFAELGRWATLDDAELAGRIKEAQGAAPDGARLARARRLFARALDTPGGLKIQTIHAFCERLLQQFPFEANVPGQFEVLDEAGAAALMAEARAAMMAEARDEESRLGQAMRRLAESAADGDIERALTCFVARREAVEAWIARSGAAFGHGNVEDAIADLRERLVLEDEDSEDAIAEAFLAAQELHIAGQWREHLLAELRANPSAANDRALAALDLCDPAMPAAERLQALFGFYLSDKLEPRAARARMTKAVAQSVADFESCFEGDIEACLRVLERIRAFRTLQATEALIVVGDAILQHYRAAKSRLGCLDYDDLIVRARNLLSRSDAAQWVLYKLDARLDHILVDEAQDTSPAQWQIIAALAGDFFAGETGAPRPRTVFAVGDDKQSIFSFQGAAPAMLAEMARAFRAEADGAGLAFRKVSMGLSFRSTHEVLSAVDQVFADPDLQASITSAGYEPHSARRADHPGRVIVWPRLVRPALEEPEDWTTPLDAPAPAEMRLAQRIAAEIAAILGKPLPSGTVLEPGGVMILVRTRGSFAAAMNRALKDAQLETAGADRIQLSQHIAVLDLMALGDVMLMPEDDLQLAALLKSPLFGLDDDDLMRLAPRRGAASLWSRLAASAEPRRRAAAERLRAWLARADRDSPFRFYARVLGADGGRRALRARLGGEVDDVLDAFMSRLLAYESSAASSLQGFLSHMRAGAGEVKREVDERAQAIRVMTVHGAKGLEADVVFLVDTGGRIVHHQHREPLLALPGAHAGAPDAFLWRRPAADATAVQRRLDAAADRAATDEYRRLLYVAMTRARDGLHVCGIRPRQSVEGCWHELVAAALAADAPRDPETGELAAPAIWPAKERPPLEARKPEAAEAPFEVEEPAWLRRPAPPAPEAPKPLRPSQALAEPDAGEPEGWAPGFAPEALAALKRGLIVHRLLQHLPQLAPEARAEAAGRLLARELPDDAEARAALADEALAVLDHPEMAALFAAGSRAEVAIVGELATARGAFAVSGQIDRMAVTESFIHIVDFKTDRAPPASAAEVPPAYVRQLALYRALIARLDPTRAVRASLLWTAGPTLMDIPDAAMDAELRQLGIISAPVEAPA